MPIVRVELYAGRSPEQKFAVARGMTDLFVAILGSSPKDVTVIFEDVEKRNWIAGEETTETVAGSERKKKPGEME